MAINPRRLKPGELCRLLNSTPMGAVIDERALQRHRIRAGLRLSTDGDQSRIDLWRFIGWLAGICGDAMARAAKDPVGAIDYAALVGAAEQEAPTTRRKHNVSAKPGAVRRATKSALCAALGVSATQAERYIDKGMPCDYSDRGIRTFNIDECRSWITTDGPVNRKGHNKFGMWGQAEAEHNLRTADGRSPAQIQLALAEMKLRDLELKIGQRAGTLVNAKDVEAAFSSHLNAVRTAFEAVPVKAASRVMAALEMPPSKQHLVIAAIQKEVFDVMMTIAAAAAPDEPNEPAPNRDANA